MREAFRRLWLIATCNHINRCKAIVFEDTTEVRFCTRCGLLIKMTDEHTARNNPHLEWTAISGFWRAQ